MLGLCRLATRRPRVPIPFLPEQQIRHSSKKSLARGMRLRRGGPIPGPRFGGKLSVDMNHRTESMIDAIRTPTPVTNPIARWRILRGDFVEVISGPEKGKRGRVIEVVRASNRVVVEGVGLVRKKAPVPGGYLKTFETESPIYVSRVAVVCPQTDLPTRVTFAFLEDGTKVRVSKRSGAIIPRPEILRQRRKPHPEDSPKDTPPTVALHRSYMDEEGLYEQYAGFQALVDKSMQ
ncbi:Ribosomal proteins 50S L24/mitochondrial 39S L24 [Gracilaria domingensis]|nr:Ribosomal proteins 50S L24/mitochondrial 39S L24 [Gracilaria domingensis]